jgi:hypothetical protein
MDRVLSPVSQERGDVPFPCLANTPVLLTVLIDPDRAKMEANAVEGQRGEDADFRIFRKGK